MVDIEYLSVKHIIISVGLIAVLLPVIICVIDAAWGAGSSEAWGRTGDPTLTAYMRGYPGPDDQGREDPAFEDLVRERRLRKK